MKVMSALLAVIILLLVVFIGVGAGNLHYLFGVIIPYFAIAVFLIGMILRVLRWAGAPVPFRIPTTCGQQKTLPWIKHAKADNPSNLVGVVGRMAAEVFLFRSLFRNTKMELKGGPKVVYGANKWLWAGALVFHYSFLVIFIRHFKFFAEPVPYFVTVTQNFDSFFQVGLPMVYITDVAIVLALGYLFFRRLVVPQMRYLSMPGDYFPLLVIGTIAITGILMRYFDKVNIFAVKELGIGLLSFHPAAPTGIGLLFYIHLFFVCTLIVYFPFSKLVHLAGVFMSPTRNLANNSRMKRHINPWNPEVKTHTYEEWEDEFRVVMKEAGMPLEKEPVEEVKE
jgi:nitrate reductase gamma subunit